MVKEYLDNNNVSPKHSGYAMWYYLLEKYGVPGTRDIPSERDFTAELCKEFNKSSSTAVERSLRKAIEASEHPRVKWFFRDAVFELKSRGTEDAAENAAEVTTENAE